MFQILFLQLYIVNCFWINTLSSRPFLRIGAFENVGPYPIITIFAYLYSVNNSRILLYINKLVSITRMVFPTFTNGNKPHFGGHTPEIYGLKTIFIIGVFIFRSSGCQVVFLFSSHHVFRNKLLQNSKVSKFYHLLWLKRKHSICVHKSKKYTKQYIWRIIFQMNNSSSFNIYCISIAKKW